MVHMMAVRCSKLSLLGMNESLPEHPVHHSSYHLPSSPHTKSNECPYSSPWGACSHPSDHCPCEHAGLPRVDPANLQVGKHAALAGVPPARRLAGAPPWTGWQVPRSLATRWLTHAVVDFGREVEGPVILGAGRFTGLGLLRPVEA